MTSPHSGFFAGCRCDCNILSDQLIIYCQPICSKVMGFDHIMSLLMTVQGHKSRTVTVLWEELASCCCTQSFNGSAGAEYCCGCLFLSLAGSKREGHHYAWTQSRCLNLPFLSNRNNRDRMNIFLFFHLKFKKFLHFHFEQSILNDHTPESGASGKTMTIYVLLSHVYILFGHILFISTLWDLCPLSPSIIV